MENGWVCRSARCHHPGLAGHAVDRRSPADPAAEDAQGVRRSFYRATVHGPLTPAPGSARDVRARRVPHAKGRASGGDLRPAGHPVARFTRKKSLVQVARECGRPDGLVLRKGVGMRQLITPVALAAAVLLGATGCVSLSPTARTVTPSHTPAAERSPSPVEWRPVQPAGREVLASSEPEVQPRKKPAQAPLRRRIAVNAHPRLPRHHAHPAPARRGTPPKAHRPRGRKPHPALRPAGPRRSYDMSGLCRVSEGVVNPGISAMCRNVYGR